MAVPEEPTMADELLDLKDAVRNAADWLDTALRFAGNLAHDDQTGALIGWKDMEGVYDRLMAVQQSLTGVLDPLGPAIQEAEAHADYMSDLADGRSY
jgi:hypothetical protein